MVLKLMRPTLLVGVVLSAWSLLGTCPAAHAGNNYQSGLFTQYYAQPGLPAALYPAPVPTPPFVGHTYITYEPLAPHEFLYQHRRSYLRINPGAGVTNTRVWWH